MDGEGTEETDDTLTGFMCLTDFEHELYFAMGGNIVYPSIEDLRRNRICVDGCGIAEVRVELVRIVQPASYEELE